MKYLIFGSPGAGKTTYVKNNKRWDDIVLDIDYLYHCLTFNKLKEKPYSDYNIIMDIYDLILEYTKSILDKNIYIIKFVPKKEEREYYKKYYITYNIYINSSLQRFSSTIFCHWRWKCIWAYCRSNFVFNKL